MDFYLDPDWAAPFAQTKHAVSRSERNEMARRASAGELVRLIPGIYLPRTTFDTRSPRQRHRDLVAARQLVSPSAPLFSHASAASLWRLPRLGSWPATVAVSAQAASGGRSTSGVTRHTGLMPAGEDRIDGIRVTSLARTLVDLARTESRENALIAADAGLAMTRFAGARVSVTRNQLEAELIRASGRGVALARWAIGFADPGAASPGESLSRLGMARERLAAPVLQQRFDDEYGSMWVDFFWPQHGLIGEFDGEGKYLRAEWADGRSPGQVVVDEKWREDRLRRLGWRVVRWGWKVALQPAVLGRMLRSAGVG